MWVLIHKVVVVCDSPFARRLVNSGDNVKELGPFKICFETHNVLCHVLIVISQKDFGIVLVLYEQLHRGFNKGSNSNAIRPVVWVNAINTVASVIGRSIVGAGSTHQRRLGLNPVISVPITSPITVESMSDLYFEYLNRRLLNSEVGHFDVQTMEVNTIKTFVDRLRKSALTNLFDAFCVRDCAVLVEFSEQDVELGKGTRVFGVHGPEIGTR